MDFTQYNFDNLNETDIREEIIAPLLRHLGYRSGTENNIIREQALSYPKLSLGRKQKNDPILRGRADYICDVQGKMKWVIEAKAPAALLDKEAEEQSWSYANHPEIRAIYFCLCNGKEFQVFQTNSGPDAEPIFNCKYEELIESTDTIRNILSPDSIIRDYPEYEIDYGKPIGTGLRSIVRVTNGSITYHSNSINLKPLIGMMTSITKGSVERNEDGVLEAYIETQVPYQSLQKLNEKLGLHSSRLTSEDRMISNDPQYPSIFSSLTNHIIPQGEMILDLTTWKEQPFPLNVTVQTQTIASGYLDGNKFTGQFKAILFYREFNIKVTMDGSFNAHLA
jgi:hypothetical protein